MPDLQAGIWFQKFPKNLQDKLGTVYKPKMALVSGRKRSGHTETHVNMNTQVPACLRLAGNPIMPAAAFPAILAQADFGTANDSSEG